MIQIEYKGWLISHAHLIINVYAIDFHTARKKQSDDGNVHLITGKWHSDLIACRFHFNSVDERNQIKNIRRESDASLSVKMMMNKYKPACIINSNITIERVSFNSATPRKTAIANVYIE